MKARSHEHILHIARVKRNAMLVAQLGLTCEKETLGWTSITVKQGEYTLFATKSMHVGDNIIVETHKKLERFLIKYQSHLHTFPNIVELNVLQPPVINKI